MISILIKTLSGELLPLTVPKSEYPRTFLCDTKEIFCKVYSEYCPELTTVFRIEEDQKVPVEEGEVLGVLVDRPIYTHETGSIDGQKYQRYKVELKDRVFYIYYLIRVQMNVVMFRIFQTETVTKRSIAPMMFLETDLWSELMEQFKVIGWTGWTTVCSIIKDDIYKMLTESSQVVLYMKYSMNEIIRCKRCGYTNKRYYMQTHSDLCYEK